MSPAASSTLLPDGGGAGPALTVMFDDPETPPLAAVIVAAPAAIPSTSPEDDTVATAGLELFHVKVTRLRGFAVAVSCTVFPTSMVALAGRTDTERTWDEACRPFSAGPSRAPGELAISLQPTARKPSAMVLG
jgi:hypothetical protein